MAKKIDNSEECTQTFYAHNESKLQELRILGVDFCIFRGVKESEAETMGRFRGGGT